MQGQKASKETKEKLSKALTGRKLTPEHIANRTKAQMGQKRSVESRERMRLAALARNAK